MLDLAIIGSGPAALSAALYVARAGKQVTVFERGEIGGELSRIDRIENYPGYSGSGRDLATAMRDQATQAGAKISYGECRKITRDKDGVFTLTIDDEKVQASTVLVASGSEPRRLRFKLKKPVSYCALCDGVLAKGQNVAVIGGGNSALQGALYLAPIVSHLTLISHSPLKADTHLCKKVRSLDNIIIHEDLEPTAKLLDDFDYIFVFIGTRPATKWLKNLSTEKVVHKDNKLFKFEIIKDIHLFDSEGYLVTGGRKRSAHATEIPGLYAAGDVRAGVTKQVVTAAADGVEAALEIIDKFQYL